MRIGQNEIEVDREISEAELVPVPLVLYLRTDAAAYRFEKAIGILNKTQSHALPTAYSPSTFSKPFKTPKTVGPRRAVGGYIPAKPEYEAGPSRLSSPGLTSMPERNSSFSIGKTVAQSSFYAPSIVKKENIVLGEKSSKERLEWGGALHNPKAEGAVVMPRPNGDHRIARDLKQRSVDESHL